MLAATTHALVKTTMIIAVVNHVISTSGALMTSGILSNSTTSAQYGKSTRAHANGERLLGSLFVAHDWMASNEYYPRPIEPRRNDPVYDVMI